MDDLQRKTKLKDLFHINLNRVQPVRRAVPSFDFNQGVWRQPSFVPLVLDKALADMSIGELAALPRPVDSFDFAGKIAREMKKAGIK